MIHKTHGFIKGLDRRFDDQFPEGAERFQTLQNARLFKRGEVGYVSRIKGYESILQDSNLSGSMDIIEYKGSLFILSRTGQGQFTITVTDTEGNVAKTLTYSGEDSDSGEFTPFEDYIYITPHNKFLALEDGQWTLHDFISTTPRIVSVTPVDYGNKAEGSITVNSGFLPTTPTHAVGRFTVVTNTVEDNREKTFAVTIGGVPGLSGQGLYTTADITVDSSMKRQDIALAVVNAINDSSRAIGEDWEAYLSSSGDVNDRWTITVRAREAGAGWNGYRISVIGEAENVIGPESRVTNRTGIRSGDPSNRTYGIRSTGLSRRTRENVGTDRSADNINRPLVSFTNGTMSGGGEVLSSEDPIKVSFVFFGGSGQDKSFNVITGDIESDDTQSQIVSKIKTALDNSSRFSEFYNSTVNGNTINMEAVTGGDNLNTNIGVRFTRTSGVFREGGGGMTGGVRRVSGGSQERIAVDIDVEPLTGGTAAGGTLDTDSDYWYKARFVYDDGHYTLSSFPMVANTGNFRTLEVVIDDGGVSDIYSQRPIIELFRKKEGTEFFLIESIRPDDDLVYSDSGSIEIRALNETPYLWTRKHKTQELVNNRLVKANVEYDDLSLEDNHFTIESADSTDRNVLPKNSKINVYVRPQYENGTFGFHKRVGEFDVKNESRKVRVQQTETYPEIKDFGVFIDSSVSSTSRQLQFNSAEIANQNIPTMESVVNDDLEEYYPNRTRILYGYKYVIRVARQNAGGMNDSIVTLVYDDVLRSTDDREHRRFFVYDYDSDADVSTPSLRSPEKIDIRIFNTRQEYIKIASQEVEMIRPTPGAPLDTYTTSVYKLANAEAIKEAAFSGQMNLSINENISNFGTTQDEVDLSTLNIKVIGLIDKSDEYGELTFTEGYPFIMPPTNSKMYLQLEESPLDNIDDLSLNITQQVEVSIPDNIFHDPSTPAHELSSINNYDYTMSFDMFSIQHVPNSLELVNPSGEDRRSSTTGRWYKTYNWREQQLEIFSSEFETLPLLYIGSKPNEVSNVTFEYTPFSLRERNNLLYTRVKENLVADDKIVESDIRRPKNIYENQLIWSEPAIQESYSSGTRNFLVTSSYNLPTNNGKIQRIVELGSRLYVFCERGIAELFVGEVVSETAGGEMFIDTSRFITDYRWFVESLKDIRPDSIVKYETSIFFSDGFDVFTISPEGLQNVSNGVIDLEGNDCVGAIDPLNMEYRLSDCNNDNTWSYSIMSGEWFGPYTYRDDKSTFFQNQMYSIIGNQLVRHNTGNTFDGQPFTTIIQSAANDLNDPVAVKMFRKFFIGTNTDNVEFSYSKDGNLWIPKSLSDARQVNGQYRIGVTSRNQPYLYWKVETQQEDFVLQNLAYQYRPRRRVR